MLLTINGLVFVPALILVGMLIFWFLLWRSIPDAPDEEPPEPSNDWLWPPIPKQYETRRNASVHGQSRDVGGGERGVR